jgi:hypothetical protein
LEEFFAAQLHRRAYGSGRNFKDKIYQFSSIGMTSTESTKRSCCNVCDLNDWEKVRLCGQVFESLFYRGKGVTFFGRAQNVRNCGAPLSVSFRSERRFPKEEIYRPAIRCVVSEGNAPGVYYAANAGDEVNAEKFDSTVFVFVQHGEGKVYLDSHIVDLTVLIPDDSL